MGTTATARTVDTIPADTDPRCLPVNRLPDAAALLLLCKNFQRFVSADCPGDFIR
jgi:hypothetical protein